MKTKSIGKKNSSLLVMILSSLALLAFLVGGLFFGAQKNGPEDDTLYKEKIVIGAVAWPGYLPLYVAEDKGFFESEGLDVEIRTYPSYAALSEDYLTGKIQGRGNITLDAVNETLQGLDHKIILGIDFSNGSDAILAKKGIDGVEDFKGKKIAYEPNSLEEFFLSWALKESDLSLEDIVPVAGNPEESLVLLETGKVDVAVSHEPFISNFLTQDKAYHQVYSSANAPGLIMDVLTFRSDFIHEHPSTIQAIVHGYFRGLDFWETQPNESYEIMAEIFQDSAENIEQQMQGIEMLNEQRNLSLFTFSSSTQSLYGNLRNVSQFVKRHSSENTETLDTDQLIDPHFIRQNEKYQQEKKQHQAYSTLVVGTVGDDPQEEIEEFQPFVDYIAQRLEPLGIEEGKVVVAESSMEMASLLRQGKVDFYIDSVFPVLLVGQFSQAEPVLSRWKGGVQSYHSVIFTQHDSDIKKVEDLKGELLAFEEVNSTSAYFLPKAELLSQGMLLEEVSEGLSPNSNKIGYYFANSEKGIFLELANGKAAAGAMSEKAFNEIAGEAVNDYRLILNTRDVYRHIVTFRSTMDEGIKSELTSILTTLHKSQEGKAVLSDFSNTSKFEAIDLDSPENKSTTQSLLDLIEVEILTNQVSSLSSR